MKIIKTKLNYAKSYTLLDIDSLALDAVTLFDIFIKKGRDYIIIIEAGTTLTQKLFDKLKKQDKLYINKSDENKQILSCETLKHYIKYNKDDHKKRLYLLYEVNNQLFEIYMVNKENRIDLGCVELIVDAIIYLLKHDELFIKNTMPYMLSDYMLQNHSLHVALYALTLGYTLKFNDEQLIKLGTAALLHDVGIKKIDKEIIYKKRSLTPKETALVQKHSQYGVEILKQNKIHDPYIIDAVMHHHESYDGTGYPNRLKQDDISDFASILAICDVFDALTNNRPHRPHYSSFDALKMMMRDTEMVNRFNQNYLHLALKLL